MLATAIHQHGPDCNHAHEHNCSTCYEESEIETRDQVRSFSKKLHEHNGHSCDDPECSIDAPHGHNKQSLLIKPLEILINESSLPQTLKEFSLNFSFLSPALLASKALEHTPLPKFIKTWLAIGLMHGINRGSNKLGRLGLTYIVSGLAALSSNLNSHAPKLVRFIATAFVAVIEKFSGHGGSSIQEEIKLFFDNLSKPKQWKELLPSLVNVETKVQVLANLSNRIVSSLTQDMQGGAKVLTETLLQATLTSLSFTGFDSLLKKLGGVFGDESVFASMVGSICGCCGSPVCITAAADSALNHSLKS